MMIRTSGVGSGIWSRWTFRVIFRARVSSSKGSAPNERSSVIPLGSWTSRSTRACWANASASSMRGQIACSAPTSRSSFQRDGSSHTSASMSRVTRGRPRNATATPPITTKGTWAPRNHASRSQRPKEWSQRVIFGRHRLAASGSTEPGPRLLPEPVLEPSRAAPWKSSGKQVDEAWFRGKCSGVQRSPRDALAPSDGPRRGLLAGSLDASS